MPGQRHSPSRMNVASLVPSSPEADTTGSVHAIVGDKPLTHGSAAAASVRSLTLGDVTEASDEWSLKGLITVEESQNKVEGKIVEMSC